MARIYKKTDRIKIKIDDVTVHIAPLSLDQKTEAQQMIAKGRIQKDYPTLTKGIVHIVRCGVKKIDGLEDADGRPYELQFENDMLTEECVDDLFNIELHKKLVMVCTALVGNIPNEFTDEQGKPIEGVELITSNKKEKPSDPN